MTAPVFLVTNNRLEPLLSFIRLNLISITDIASDHTKLHAMVWEQKTTQLGQIECTISEYPSGRKNMHMADHSPYEHTKENFEFSDSEDETKATGTASYSPMRTRHTRNVKQHKHDQLFLHHSYSKKYVIQSSVPSSYLSKVNMYLLWSVRYANRIGSSAR